jgi:hypothetical protein
MDGWLGVVFLDRGDLAHHMGEGRILIGDVTKVKFHALIVSRC